MAGVKYWSNTDVYPTTERPGFNSRRVFGAPRGERLHAGGDLAVGYGADVYSPIDGEVVAVLGPTWSGETPSLAVLVYDESTDTTLNLGEVEPLSLVVAVGDTVTRGQYVGTVCATGVLHIEWYAGRQVKTRQWPAGESPPDLLLDPMPWLRQQGAADDEPADDEPADDEPADDEPADDEPAEVPWPVTVAALGTIAFVLYFATRK